jgi:hypothetical protein
MNEKEAVSAYRVPECAEAAAHAKLATKHDPRWNSDRADIADIPRQTVRL